MKTKDGFASYFAPTFLISFGFFTMGLMDPLYDTYLPAFLGEYISSKTLTGFLMTLDNILQLFLIPIVAVWSDRTRTRIGRRMPFIIVMLPLAALFFGLIPGAARVSLTALLAVVFLLNIFKTSVRGPIVALMPDTIPGEYRSEANGVINMMGGVGTIIASLFLARLMDVDTVLPVLGATKNTLPFQIAGICVFAAVVILFVFVREKKHDEASNENGAIALLKSVIADKDKSALYILISLFLWFSAHGGVVLWLGVYLRDVLGASSGQMSLPQGVAGISYALMAIPMGYAAHKFGRKKTIRVSLIGLFTLTGMVALLNLTAPILALTGKPALYIFLGLMFAYGIFWGAVTTNSFPMLWQMADFGTIGMMTGLYYVFSQSANILAPPVTGFILDAAKFFNVAPEYEYTGIFLFAAVLQITAFALMSKVKKGEAEKKRRTLP